VVVVVVVVVVVLLVMVFHLVLQNNYRQDIKTHA
jgi:hypothetical protein